MELDFAEVLLEVMELNASDLHLTAGSPPMVRERGRLRPLDYPPLDPQITRDTVYSILSNDQRQRLETDWQIDLSYSIPGKARFRVNAYFQRAADRGGVPPDPARDPAVRIARPAARAARLHAQAARFRAGDRPDRLG